MGEKRINYQVIIDIFNQKYEQDFSTYKIDYLEFDIWYDFYSKVKKYNLVNLESLQEMANTLYNSYIIFSNYEEETKYNEQISFLKKDLEIGKRI
ncbi:MAG: hypothetical protein IJ501_05170 [Bacilli bacterium]|nr:hypothetical protein [Bacilli bacterium]